MSTSTTDTRISSLRRTLRSAGIYDKKLEPQIRLTARLESLLERMEDTLAHTDMITMEISATGTEKQVLNPILTVLTKLEAQLQSAYSSLGLNYGINPNNIHDSRPQEQEKSALSSFIESLQPDKP